jgi:hypothetical protein
VIPIEGEGFTIEHRWKEETIYWEESQGFLLDGGWGVDPPVLYVPSAEIWAEVMPPWLRDRRDEVVDRLETFSGHRIVEDVHGYYRNSPDARSLQR